MKFEHLHSLPHLSTPLLLQVFRKKRRGQAVLEGGEGSRHMKCMTSFHMQRCKVRKAAERRNSSVKISERMLQHAVTRHRLPHCIPNDSTVSYASSNKSFCCLPSITTKVPNLRSPGTLLCILLCLMYVKRSSRRKKKRLV